MNYIQLSVCGMGGGLVTGVECYKLGYLSKLGTTRIFITAAVCAFLLPINNRGLSPLSSRSGGPLASFATSLLPST
jgi:hypothetical protein